MTSVAARAAAAAAATARCCADDDADDADEDAAAASSPPTTTLAAADDFRPALGAELAGVAALCALCLELDTVGLLAFPDARMRMVLAF